MKHIQQCTHYIGISNVLINLTLTRPPSRSSLKITNRSFRYAAPCLWNELPTELRLPRHTQSSPPLPSFAHGSSLPPLSPPSPLSVTTSVFHSELKTWPFGKSFPPYAFSLPIGLTPRTT